MLTSDKSVRKFKKTEKGTAIIETVPVLFMLVVVFNFSLGFFGAIHSGILNSIASYNYALETFRYKSDLIYFRPGSSGTPHFTAAKNRVHGTVQDGSESKTNEEYSKWPATLRAITFNFVKDDPNKGLKSVTDAMPESARNYAGRTSDNNIWYADSKYVPEEGNSIQTPRIWIKTVYGICIKADCE